MPANDLKERLTRAAGGLSVPDPPVSDLVRRGRRRLALRIAGSTLSVLLLAGAITWSISSLASLSSGRHAPRPATAVSPPAVRLSTSALNQEPVALTNLDGQLYVLGAQGVVWHVDSTTLRPLAVVRVPRGRNIVGGGGFLWVSLFRRAELVRVDPVSGARKTLPVKPASPFSYAYGLDSLWVATAQSQLLRIDPTTGTQVATFTIPGKVSLNPSPHVAVADANVFISGGRNGTLVWIDPSADPSLTEPTSTFGYSLRPSPRPDGLQRVITAGINALAVSGPVVWSCCDGRGSVNAFHVHGGGGEGSRPLPDCLLPWQPQDSIAAQANQVWVFSPGSFCGPKRLGPGDVFRIRSDFPEGLNYLPYPSLDSLYVEGPIVTGARSGAMAVAADRVWIIASNPDRIVSFPTDVDLPVFAASGRGGRGWTAQRAALLATVSILLATGFWIGWDVRSTRRRRELTPR